MPCASSDLPEAGGPRQRFYSVLLRMGFTYALSVTRKAVVSYTALPPLLQNVAVYFSSTFHGVTSTGRYPASCPMKPGLSSPAVFRHLQPRSFVLLNLLLLYRFFLKCKANIRNLLCYLLRLYMKATSTNKFTDNRIAVNRLAWNR